MFPPFYPDLEAKHHPMQQFFISYLHNTQELEFDHEYINEMIEKFTIHPNQCNKCNNLSKVFMNPEYYYNNLYIKNSKWKLNEGAELSLDMEPYQSLTVLLFDRRNINIKHPSNRPQGKIHLIRETSDLQGKHNFNNTAKWSSISALKKL